MNDLEQQQAPSPLDENAQQMAELHGGQNLAMGFVGGLIAALVGAVLWAVITIATGWQIGFMAVGIGFLVGYAIRALGKGMTPVFGYMGAVLALLGCLFGNYLTIVGWVANELEIGYIEAFSKIPFSLMKELMIENFSLIDLLFYGIAIYEGYKLSFVDLTVEE